MQYRFNRHLERLLPAYDRSLRILVAVSGGADSMCLLELLRRSSLNISLSIAHVNFHLRGEESNGDEKFVRDWAASHSIECHVLEADTVSYAKQNSLSIEMAAREIRYNWFNTLKEQYSFDFVAVAHHANDNAETLLLNLVRGAGIAGIGGMKELDMGRSLLRPLLRYSRQDIETFLSRNNIPFRTDHTNFESDFARNRIRNIVMPHLEKINPAVIQVLNRDMKYFGAASSILDKMAQEKREELCNMTLDEDAPMIKSIKSAVARAYMLKVLPNHHQFHISVGRLLQEPEYEYWLYQLLREYMFNSAQTDDLAGSLENDILKRIVSPTHTAIKERGYIKVYRNSIFGNESPVQIDNLEVPVEITLSCGAIVRLEVIPVGSVGKNRYGDGGIRLLADAGKLSFPLQLRRVQAGDRFRPFGMDGMKKLNDYLSDIKLDNLLKTSVPVLCESGKKNSPGNIVCMPGLQISNSFRVNDKTVNCLVITLL